MNKARRAALSEIQDTLTDLQEQIQALMEEEEEYRDNMPENFQGGGAVRKSRQCLFQFGRCRL